MGDCMRAHVIENGVVIKTIVVNTLNDFPNLIDTTLGGNIGDLWDGEVFTTPEPEIVVPQVVTMRQARLALHTAGLLSTVDAAVASADDTTKIEWEYSQELKRNWPTLLSLTTALGMTSGQVDDLFILAATL